MQQPANLSGTPVIVSVQTAPIETRKSLGCMPGIAVISSHVLWLGSQFIVTGAFGIYAGRTGGRCQVITFHVLSTISAVFVIPLLCIALSCDSSTDPDRFSGYKMPEGVVITLMESLVAALGIAEAVVAIRSSVIGCTIGVCCCKCGGSCCCPTDPQYQQLGIADQPDLTQEQSLASSQQEPTFKTNQEQLVLKQNQQPMFNPNQQQPTFNPDQQVPMFNPNHQQPMFNPNQQQLIFLSTQPNVGFYPQHQAVQCYALQPITALGSHQTDASTILSGALGQGQHAGPLTELKAPTLIGNNNTGTRGDDGSDEGQISSGDVEMLSP